MISYKNVLKNQFLGAILYFVSICIILYASYSFDWRIGLAITGIYIGRFGGSLMDGRYKIFNK